MKKTQILSLLLALLFSAGLFVLPAAAETAEEEMTILGTAALLVDADHDEVLFSQNGYDRRYPASITKVMTAILVIEAVDGGVLSLDQVITASPTHAEGLSIYGSTQNIKVGEEMSVRNLLYCMLVSSANEACNILAEAVSGSVSAFVERMNQKAAELGMTGTHFVNPHGLHDDDHYTTAYDIYLMAQEGLKHELFRTIVATTEYQVPPTNLTDTPRNLHTTNYLLTARIIPGYTLSGAIGIKTGSTDEAGQCLVSAAERDGRRLIAVVLGASNIRLEDGTLRRLAMYESRRLLQWGFSNFSRQALLEAGAPTQEVPVTLSKEAQHIMAVPAQSIEATLPNSLKPEDFQQVIDLPESIAAPIEEGQVLGTVTLTYNGESYGTVDLVARNSVSMSMWLYRQQQVVDFFSHHWGQLVAAVVLLTAAVIILKLTLFRRSRRYGRPSSPASRPPSYRGNRRR